MTDPLAEIRDAQARIERKLDALLLRRRGQAKGAVKRSVAVAHRAAAEVRTLPDDVTRQLARNIARRKGLVR